MSSAQSVTYIQSGRLLTLGNGKLGPGVWHFNLPAGTSCPGRTALCSAVCYASKGRYRMPSVRNRYQALWERAQDLPQLEADLDAELTTLGVCVVRIHTSGDFFNVAYTNMWARLAIRHTRVRLFAYTRSWRVPELLPALEFLRAMPNVRLWASTDDETGPAPDGWRQARIGYAPGYACCPEQTGRQASCTTCGLCFADRLRPDAKLAFRPH